MRKKGFVVEGFSFVNGNRREFRFPNACCAARLFGQPIQELRFISDLTPDLRQKSGDPALRLKQNAMPMGLDLLEQILLGFKAQASGHRQDADLDGQIRQFSGSYRLETGIPRRRSPGVADHCRIERCLSQKVANTTPQHGSFEQGDKTRVRLAKPARKSSQNLGEGLAGNDSRNGPVRQVQQQLPILSGEFLFRAQTCAVLATSSNSRLGLPRPELQLHSQAED
jgi:hypothetical protein